MTYPFHGQIQRTPEDGGVVGFSTCKPQPSSPSAFRLSPQGGTKRLLSDNSLSFADIGDKFGITRERVRQIARQLGMTSGLHAKCREFGYAVTPNRVDGPAGWRFQARIVVINGWRAQIVYMRTRGRYLAFARSDIRADFYVGISPIGFFIFHQRYGRHFRSELCSLRSLARLANPDSLARIVTTI